jgi:hypothetical protein
MQCPPNRDHPATLCILDGRNECTRSVVYISCFLIYCSNTGHQPCEVTRLRVANLAIRVMATLQHDHSSAESLAAINYAIKLTCPFNAPDADPASIAMVATPPSGQLFSHTVSQVFYLNPSRLHHKRSHHQPQMTPVPLLLSAENQRIHHSSVV